MIKKAKYIKLTPAEYKRFLSNNWREKFDKLIVVLGLVNVIATIPQITQIWRTQDASGVSLVTWTYYVVFTVILLVYAVSIKANPMIIMYTGNTIVYSIVLIGVIIF
jgi:uncharacterized protein with PQ loop repeat